MSMYAPEAKERIDFTKIGSLEMAKDHSYKNYKANPEATMFFYQPPMIIAIGSVQPIARISSSFSMSV